MDKRPAARRVDRGIASVQFVLAGAMAMVMFVLLANLIVVQYGRGAVRSALEQGARAGSVGGPAWCLETARGVVSDLLGGAMSDDVLISCQVVGDRVVARADGSFRSWVPPIPSFDVDIEAGAVAEP